MGGQELLRKHIGHKLNGGLLQSFYLKQELVDLINITFLKFDNEWVSIVITDDMTNIKGRDNPIENVKFYGDEHFNYPIGQISQVFSDFNKLINKRLLNFKELVLKDNETISCGLHLYFDDNFSFIIKNNPSSDNNEYFFDDRAFKGVIGKQNGC